MADLLYPEDSYYILGLCYSIQNELGAHLKERPYAEAVEIKFKKDGKQYLREYEIMIPFEGSELGGNKVDFFYERKILVDIKAKNYITKEDYMQMLRYLEASGLKLGIIVNFRGPKVTCKRVINSKGKDSLD